MSARAHRRGDGGSMTVELVLLAPVFVLFLLVIVAVGRIAEAGEQVTGAARDAARAASQARTADQAAAAAVAAAEANLAGQDVDCSSGPSVLVDTDHWQPGGWVRVQVTCVANLADIGFPYLDAQHEMTGEATSPLELYRGTQ